MHSHKEVMKILAGNISLLLIVSLIMKVYKSVESLRARLSLLKVFQKYQSELRTIFMVFFQPYLILKNLIGIHLF